MVGMFSVWNVSMVWIWLVIEVCVVFFMVLGVFMCLLFYFFMV